MESFRGDSFFRLVGVSNQPEVFERLFLRQVTEEVLFSKLSA